MEKEVPVLVLVEIGEFLWGLQERVGVIEQLASWLTL